MWRSTVLFVALMLVACGERDLPGVDGPTQQQPDSGVGHQPDIGGGQQPDSGAESAPDLLAGQLVECPTTEQHTDSGLTYLIELEDGDPCDAGLACFKSGSASGWGWVEACFCVGGEVSCNSLDISDGASCAMLPEGTSVFNTCPCANQIGDCDGASTCTNRVWVCTPNDLHYGDGGI
jgi:hypothetical protein